MQFLSVDPLVDQTGQPYAYTADSPLNMVDPTGLKGCNGAQWQGWARLGSAVGDLFCNAGEVKDTLLTGRSNGTTDALVNEGQSLIFGPATVAGGPSSACEYPAYY